MKHACDLAERIGELLFSEKYSDVIFIVDGERFPAHRAILTTSCEYFRALLEGDMKESLQRDVTLHDIPLRGFKLVMCYVYTGQLQLRDLDEDAILEVLGIAHLYGLENLENALSQHLQGTISSGNVLAIYSRALSLRIDRLVKACHSFIVVNHGAILQSEGFLELSEAVLCHMISENTFCVGEIDIFNAVVRWCAKQPAERDHSKVLKAIRLPLIEIKDLMTTVKDSGLLSTDLLLVAIQTRACRFSEMSFRGSLKSGVNLANHDLGARKLTPSTGGNYETSKSSLNYDIGYINPKLNFSFATGLIIALDKPYFINHITFTPNGHPNSYAYFIEVSMNLEDWARIIDHTGFSCRSEQRLYFEPRAAQYIRLMMTWANPRPSTIELSALKIIHTIEALKLRCGFFAPTENVSSAALGAIVIDSDFWSHERDGLIREQATDDPDKSQWSLHKIGGNPITIALTQPFTVDSMRMLLRGDGTRAYKYYVEVSLDKKEWTRVANHTDDFRSSWQVIVFEARPVLYIRIVGTAATVGEDFSCSSFECPASRPTRAGNSAGDDVTERIAAKRKRVL